MSSPALTAKIALVSSLVMAGAVRADDLAKEIQQIAELAKATAGTWKCDGTSPGMDGKDIAFHGTYTSKLDLDALWIHNSFVGTMGAGKSATKYKFEAYTTWDAALARWREVYVDNFGGQIVSVGDAQQDGKLETTGESRDPMGASKTKDHLDISDPKKLQLSGEQSKDGKTWQKTYELTCKK